MESRLYDLGYMNVMAYPNAVEAYRTDQIESITTMPAKAGNIYGQDGYWSWWSAVPADSGDASGGSSSTGWSSGSWPVSSSSPVWAPSSPCGAGRRPTSVSSGRGCR